jgi:hypothetical protein
MRSFTSLVLLGSSLTFAACAASTETSNDDSAESAIDSADSASSEGDLMMAITDGSDQSPLTGASVTAQVAVNLGARFQPPSCVTVAPSATAIKAVFNDCTGVRGLTHVTGELDLVISISLQGAISLHATSSDLKVNGADLAIDATATYSSQGPSHTLTVETSGSGTGPLGRTVEHDGSYTIAWDTSTQCHSITGMWSTELGGLSRSNEVDVARCGNGCPTGTIVHKFVGNRTLTVTFDGTATARWVGSAGASGTVKLSCSN